MRIESKITVLVLCFLLTISSGAQPVFARVILVQKENVNIRQGAETTSAIVDNASKGMSFSWEGVSNGWTQISYADDKQGFIRNDMLQGYDDVVVTGASVRVRQEPTLRSEILGNVKSGYKLPVLAYQMGWYKVRFGQLDGWISSDYVRLGTPIDLSSVPEESQSPQAGENAVSPDETKDAAQNVQKPDRVFNFDSAIVSTEIQPGILNGKIITLDPGHGTISEGKPVDPGALGTTLGIWEKDVNLDIALKLKKILEGMGATVWMTHTGTTSLDLYGRAALANQNNSHIFVSIHTNSSESSTLNGHSVYFYAPTGDKRLSAQRTDRKALASYVQTHMVQACGLADLGVRENSFVVLRETNCPSILVETAFLSYPQEELLLSQGAFRQKLAEAVAKGIMNYFGVV